MDGMADGDMEWTLPLGWYVVFISLGGRLWICMGVAAGSCRPAVVGGVVSGGGGAMAIDCGNGW